MKTPAGPAAPGPIRIALSLGSNIGNRSAHLELAKQHVENQILTDSRCSRLYETEALDCPPNTPAFLNMAITGFTLLCPEELLACCQTIETDLGRPRNRGYHESRTIDVDILLYGESIISEPHLIIPHKHMLQRLFVLQPLAEIAADWPVPPESTTVAFHLDALLQDSTRMDKTVAVCLNGEFGDVLNELHAEQ